MANRNEQLREYEMEAALLSGAEDRYGIYQIADGTRAEEYAFMSMDFVEKNGMKVLREDYQLVYSGILGADETLDTLYEKFNLYHPEDFKGHSLSVSDIVVLHTNGGNMAHYVDSFGFREVPDFLNLEEERVYTLNSGEKPEKYLLIRASEEGFDYSFYDGEYKLIDGGVITNTEQPMENAIRDILRDAVLQVSDRITDVEGFLESVREAEKQIGTMGKTENAIEYYVAECEEFHDMRGYYRYPDLKSAAEKYRELLDDPEKSYSGNGMGIIYHGAQDDIYNNSEICLVSDRVVCGNAFDELAGIADKAEVVDALRQVKEEFSEFKYVLPANEKGTDKERMTAEELAVQIDRLSHDFDPYDYQDTLNGDRDHVEDITYSLYTGGAKHYCSYLDDIIAEGGALATDAENLKEKLMVFEPEVSSDRVPMVRIDICDSSKFVHERYMPIGAFDSAVDRMDEAWSKENAGKDEDKMKNCRVQFTLFYADEGEMKKMGGSLDIGSGNGGLISNLASQTEYRLTDENWIAYKRGQGQEAYDKYIADLTDMREHVLPYLQSFCGLEERAPEHADMQQEVSFAGKDKEAALVSKAAENGIKTQRKAEPQRDRKSIHERLEINKARLKSQPEKKDQVKGVELT